MASAATESSRGSVAAAEPGPSGMFDVRVDVRCLDSFEAWLRERGFRMTWEVHSTRVDGSEVYEGRFLSGEGQVVGVWRVVYLNSHWFLPVLRRHSPVVWGRAQAKPWQLEPGEDPQRRFRVAVQPLWAQVVTELAEVLQGYEGRWNGARPRRAVAVYQDYCRGRHL